MPFVWFKNKNICVAKKKEETKKEKIHHPGFSFVFQFVPTVALCVNTMSLYTINLGEDQQTDLCRIHI